MRPAFFCNIVRKKTTRQHDACLRIIGVYIGNINEGLNEFLSLVIG